MNEEPTASRPAPTRATVLAWADAHSLDISNTEADDLVRRLWHLPTPFEPEAVERCVTDALLLLAESEEHDEPTAERLRRLAAGVSDTMVSLGLVRQAPRVMPDGEPDSPDGLVENDDANDDDGPGAELGEAEGSLRFDAIYCTPVVSLTLNGKKATAYWPPSFGMLKLEPDGSRRSVVVALDDLDNHNRLILRAAPTRRRTKAVVRCCAKQCNRSYTAWIRTDTRIEDVEGRPINEFGVLFAARCERHRESL